MLVFLDRERLEPPLPDVPARLVMAMIAADVRRQEPLHPPAEIAIARRPEHRMEVLRHQAIAQNPHRESLGRRADQSDEGRIIVDLMKDLRPGIPLVEDLVTVISLRGSGCPLLPFPHACSRRTRSPFAFFCLPPPPRRTAVVARRRGILDPRTGILNIL